MSNDMLYRTALTAALLAAAATVSDASTWSGVATADAFVATGAAGNPAGTDLTANNYGGAGALEISGAGTTKGEFQTLLKFNLAEAGTLFDAQYGAGNWQITSITLTLASNFGVQGSQPSNNLFNTINAGGFAIDWLADDSWVEGSGSPGSPGATGVTYRSRSTLVTSGTATLGNYVYTPPGNNVPLTWTLDLPTAFVNDATSASDVSLLLHATDGSTVGYLFNSKTFASNNPVLTVTAVPEPGATALLLAGAAALALTLRRRA
ncbi:hypothetical protein BH09VER1_BH09VER1_52040 [soil metagenome]